MSQIVPQGEQLPQPKVPVLADQFGVQFRSLDELARLSMMIQRSRMAPKGFETPEAIAVAIQAGAELGLGPMKALQSIALINGRPCLWGDAPLALCQAHPLFESIAEDISGDSATCTVKRKGMPPVVRTFGVNMAKRAGLWGKSGPWSQYPERMLQMRARSWALRDAFADALAGTVIREEYEGVETRQPERKAVAAAILPDEPPALDVPKPLALTGAEVPEGQEGKVHDVETQTGELL